MSAAGGQPQAVADAPGQLLGGAWAPDGTIVVGTYRMSAAGGTLAPFVALGQGQLVQGFPRLLPDGRRFLFAAWTPAEEKRDICMASIDDPTAHCLGLRATLPVGLAHRYLLYTRGSTLLAVPFDGRDAKIAGDPIVVAEHLASSGVGTVTAAVGGTSTMVYAEAGAPEVRQLVWVDRHGTRLGVVDTAAVARAFDVSGDGALVVIERPEGEKRSVWMIDSTRGLTTRVEGDPSDAPMSRPLLSADGKWITYLSQHDGRTFVFEQAAYGGARRVLFEYLGEGVVYLADRLNDKGETLVGIAERNRRVPALVRDGNKALTAVGLEGVQLGETMRLSPDGRWLAYAALSGGQPEIYVSPLPPTGERWQVSASGGQQPQWRADGGELYYLALDDMLMAVPIEGAREFRAGRPAGLFRVDQRAGAAIQAFAVTADGRRFLLNVLREGDRAATTTTLQVVLNWTSSLSP